MYDVINGCHHWFPVVHMFGREQKKGCVGITLVVRNPASPTSEGCNILWCLCFEGVIPGK